MRNGGWLWEMALFAPLESRDSFPIRMAYLSVIGVRCERVLLGLPAHFEVQLGILLRLLLVLGLVRGPCHGYLHGGRAVVGGA